MRQELEDNWNTIILTMATRGGYMVEKSSKLYLCIPEMVINDLTDRPQTEFREFCVSSREYKAILTEVQTLNEELFLQDEEQRLKKEEAARKRAATRAKNKKAAAKKAASQK